jgi:hypothetical protein
MLYKRIPAIKATLPPLIMALFTTLFATPIFADKDEGFFAIATGAETLGYYQKLFPLLNEAGIKWVRIFPEWAQIQPKEGEWDFSLADSILKSAKENNLQILGIFLYLAPWVSAKPPSTRAFPIKDIKYWRDYVREVVKRYKGQIKYWEVYNEFAAFSENGTPKDYADLVKKAYEVAKEIDPECKIGMNWNEFDLTSLEKVIELGAGGHFDFVCVHPYALLDRVMKGREEAFISMMDNFRKLLRKTGQREDIPLWVSEVGQPARNEPASQLKQAEALVKVYTLCLGQGIERVFWFEGRGPSYGEGGSFGIIGENWEKLPSFYALQTLTRLLGPNPKYLGWFPLSPVSHSFVFQGEKEAVMISWAMVEGIEIPLPKGVRVLDLTGKPISINDKLSLPKSPIFILNLPNEWVKQAMRNKGKIFPWQRDFSKAKEVYWKMEEDGKDVESGLYLIDWQDKKDIIQIDGSYARRTNREKRIYYLEFDVADSFASIGDNELEITVVARRLDANQPEGSGCNLIYESKDGYRHINDWWTIPSEPGWHQHTFHIKDANFANCWGWNFCISVVASPGDICVKEVTVRKR